MERQAMPRGPRILDDMSDHESDTDVTLDMPEVLPFYVQMRKLNRFVERMTLEPPSMEIYEHMASMITSSPSVLDKLRTNEENAVVEAALKLQRNKKKKKKKNKKNRLSTLLADMDDREEYDSDTSHDSLDSTGRLIDDEEAIITIDELALLTYLQNGHAETLKKCNPTPMQLPSTLRVQPEKHQLTAATWVHDKCIGFNKGAIIADPPGFGKTLIMLLAACALRNREEDGIILIVVPASCALQWVSEINKYFKSGTFNVLHLHDATFPPFELMEYDIVVTTYSYLVAERSRMVKYLRSVRRYRQGKELSIMQLPHLCLTAGVFRADAAGPVLLGKYIIFDEAHGFKNPQSRTYEACQYIREHFESCIMATGTLLDNTWEDAFAPLTMLRGHPVTSMEHMRLAFTAPNDRDRLGKKAVPEGIYAKRFGAYLDMVVIRRPMTTFCR